MQRYLAFASILMISNTALAQSAEFVPMPGIGDEPGCNPNVCIVSGSAGYSGVRISDDGRVVVSLVYEPGFIDGAVPRYVARWLPGSDPQIITPVLESLYPAVGISADGSVILGDRWRWTAASGYQDLLSLLVDERGFWTSLFFGLSDDAQVYAGIRGIYPDPGDMFTLRPSTGQRTVLARPAQVPTGYFYFNTISGNGQVVAGSARQIPTGPGQSDGYAPVIIRNGVPRLIAPVATSNFQGVTDLSFDGSVAVGVIAQSFQLKAFRWTSAGGIEILDEGAPGDFGSSYSRAVNRDATVVVGEYLQFGTAGTRAWIWRVGEGFRDLQDELETIYGLGGVLSGWQLLVATDVSGDGKSIVGQGRNPQGREQAFLVRLNDDACPADFNADGFLDFFDLDEFVACFEGDQCPPGKTADFNADGFIDFFDFDDYVAAFERGC